MKRGVVIQIGHSRDGLRNYSRACNRRGLDLWVVDGPEGWLACRKGSHLGEPSFEQVVFTRSSSPESISTTVGGIAREVAVRLVVPGFELFTLTAEEVSRRIGLPPANPRSVIEAFRLKSVQRERVREALGASVQPRFRACRNLDALEPAARALGFPLVIKPEDAGGSMGVRKVHSLAECRSEMGQLRGLVLDHGLPASGTVLLEELLGGEEIDLQGVVDGEGLVTLMGMSRKRLDHGEDGSRFLERQHVVCPPSMIPERIGRTSTAIVRALGLRSSPFHMDMRVLADGRAVLLETGARLSGAGIPRLLRHATGCDWGEAALQVMLGEPLKLPEPAGPPRCAGLRFLTASETAMAGNRLGDHLTRSGEILRVTIWDQFVSNREGYAHISDRAGFIEAVASSPERVAHLLDEAHAALGRQAVLV